MTAFDQAFAIVIGKDGGYLDNPADLGGNSKFGIRQKAYPNLDIAGLILAGSGEQSSPVWQALPGFAAAVFIAVVLKNLCPK